ncbi:MAG TPA: hypothetical protein VEX38_04775, partial [Fimbriimonadaceae bacterium]|nr:hypothetical protein [Fimbriimonadaceae bacterium]
SRAGTRRFKIYRYDPDLDPDRDDRNGEGNPNNDLELFDIDAYETWLNNGSVYPFTRGMMAAHGRSGWLANAGARASFAPFIGDTQSGKVFTSFGIDEVGQDDPNGTTAPRADNNLPFSETGPATTPQSEPNLGGNFYDYTTINQRYNKLWSDMDNPTSGIPDIRPNLHRYVDLRVTQNADGTDSPLHPDPTIGFSQAQIVPGSEVVYGPDQNPGPNYGNEVRYTRTTRNPGPNQYRLNYTDLREPDYAQLGLPAPPAAYDPQNFMSAVYQPRFKVGYVQLYSEPNVGLPGDSAGGGRIRVFYKFQLNGPVNPSAPNAANKGGDTVTVDYDTRQIISVLLTVRNYPQSTLPNPQSITLKATAPVRNTIR